MQQFLFQFLLYPTLLCGSFCCGLHCNLLCLALAVAQLGAIKHSESHIEFSNKFWLTLPLEVWKHFACTAIVSSEIEKNLELLTDAH